MQSLLPKTLLLAGLISIPMAVAQALTLAQMQPVVVSTSPVAGTTQVSPLTNEIRVQFRKAMTTNNSWSVVVVPHAEFPKLAGNPYFLDDKRTLVMPVKLEKSKTYAFGFNSKSKTVFKDAADKSAMPYVLSFATGN